MNAQPTLLDVPGRRRCERTCRPAGPSHAHCGACHRTFASVSDFDRHRVDGGHGEGRCTHPGALGLVEHDRLWATPERHANDVRLAGQLAATRATRDHQQAPVPATDSDGAAFNRADWLVWSHHHHMWWRANGAGYCSDVNDAGRYTWAAAVDACSRRSWPDDEHPPEVAVLAPARTDPGLMELMDRLIAAAGAHAVQQHLSQCAAGDAAGHDTDRHTTARTGNAGRG